MPMVRFPGCSSELTIAASHLQQQFYCSQVDHALQVPPSLVEMRTQSEESNRRFGFVIEDFERVTTFIEDEVKEDAWAVLKAVSLDRARREKILAGYPRS